VVGNVCPLVPAGDRVVRNVCPLAPAGDRIYRTVFQDPIGTGS
jgi:hypothetical protein